jgi:glucokinase
MEVNTKKKNSPPSGSILAGDIGATKVKLAIFNYDGKNLSLKKEIKYPTIELDDAITMLNNFLGDEKLPDVMCFGVAGPVQEGRVKLINSPLEIDVKKISGRFKNVPVYLINDLEAMAYGISALPENDFHVLYDIKDPVAGNKAVIAPGTGLGEAGMVRYGNNYYPFATEGGHSDFAPRNETDIEIYRFLHNKFNHVSWERVISGQGINNIFEFLQTTKGREVPAWLAEKMSKGDKAAVISSNAETVLICQETMDLFLRFLAIESANLVLKLKATSGLFIGGGIIPKIMNLVKAESFLENFFDCGRLSKMMELIPVKIILNQQTPLYGAALYAISGHASKS